MPWAINPVGTQYWQVTVYPRDVEDAVAFFYTLPIAGGLEWEDGMPVESPFVDLPMEPGRPFVRAYFPDPLDHSVRSGVEAWAHRRGLSPVWRLVDTEDWAEAWKAYYHPVLIEGGYAIVPAWEGSSPVDDRHTLWLDPGMAFGTGTHPTTRMCLQYLAQADLRGLKVLDLGAGSGILGLMAALRGADLVTMVEPDVVAVKALQQNVALNTALASRAHIMTGTLADVPAEPYHVLCLNIIYDIIRREWVRLQHYRAPGAQVLLSGLLEERVDDVRQMVEETSGRVVKVVIEGGWALMVVEA